MALTWHQPRMGRWVGVVADGEPVGQVGEVVSGGGGHRYWHAWRRDGTPMGNDLGGFASEHEAMAAVDQA